MIHKNINKEPLRFFILFLIIFISSAHTQAWRTLAQINFLMEEGNSLDPGRVMYPQILVQLKFSGGLILLDLQRNKLLISDNYTETEGTEEEVIQRTFKKTDFLCYYYGHVINYESSKVAVSLCNGLSGSIMMNNSMFELHPAEKLNNKWKYVYIERSEMERKYFCDNESTPKKLKKPVSRMKRIFKTYETKTKIVEVFLALDSTYIANMNFDKEKSIQRAVEIINGASLLYHSLNIVLMITGITILENNTLPSNGTVANFLANWNIYRNNFYGKWTGHDVDVLVMWNPKNLQFLGMAYASNMCNTFSSVAVIQGSPVGFLASVTTAHEIGHIFGLHHDQDYEECKCPKNVQCIMGAHVSSGNAYTWSDCSIAHIVGSSVRSMSLCLYDGGNGMTDSMCGDGILDPTEQCDCGRFPSYLCNEDCCNNQTCQLVRDKSCAQGSCCDIPNCKFKKNTAVCRHSRGECDIQEVCDGISNLCPKDVWIPNAKVCTDGNYCYKGECVSRDKACSFLFGARVPSSPIKCYNKNQEGTRHFNCGYDPRKMNSFYKCDKKNVECGKLLCNVPSEIAQNMFRPHINWYEESVGGVPCISVYFYLNSGHLDYVPDGSKCGDDKICLARECSDRKKFIARTKNTMISGFARPNVEALRNGSVHFVIQDVIVFILVLSFYLH